ncbi:hypothetical protein LCGC14_1192470 [marine sediment metagenome]|uniref:Uncharacterized protein n=1 Tax=marine sediment metagenome TaxID=412755 RepID=A0A0F9M6S1_9ZZZZ
MEAKCKVISNCSGEQREEVQSRVCKFLNMISSKQVISINEIYEAKYQDYYVTIWYWEKEGSEE